MTSYVYIRSEPQLWTVGYYRPDGFWEPESDHDSKEEAAQRVRWLHGEPASSERVEVVTARAIRRYVCEALRFNGDHAGASVAAEWAAMIEAGKLPLEAAKIEDLTLGAR